MDAHGSIGCLRRYRESTNGGGTVINARRNNPGTAIFLLNHAISLVLGLAGVWGGEIGFDMGDLASLHERWAASQPDKWEQPEE